MTAIPERKALLRLRALLLDAAAARLRMEAAACRATIATAGLAAALKAGAEQDERELLSFHPDVMEMDMNHAAWYPQSWGFTAQALPAGWAAFGGVVAAPTVSLHFKGEQAAPLRTGPLSGRRADHAGRLRVARLRRWVARREGRPVCTRQVQVYVPNARLERGR
jgi:hypothetical protein